MKTLLLTAIFFTVSAFAKDKGLLITKIQHGDYWISVYSDSRGARYDVNNKEGQLLAEDATVDQLQAKLPEVYSFVKSAVAFDASGNDPLMSLPRIDATSDF